MKFHVFIVKFGCAYVKWKHMNVLQWVNCVYTTRSHLASLKSFSVVHCKKIRNTYAVFIPNRIFFFLFRTFRRHIRRVWASHGSYFGSTYVSHGETRWAWYTNETYKKGMIIRLPYQNLAINRAILDTDLISQDIRTELKAPDWLIVNYGYDNSLVLRVLSLYSSCCVFVR